MESIEIAHPYTRKLLFISYVLSFVFIFLFLLFSNNCYIILLIISQIVLGVSYAVVNKRQAKQLQYLIFNCDAIIDQKKLNIIDGEGEIAVLSHKIYILNKRYSTLLNKMKQEQLKLKDYIEDISHQLKTPITSLRLNTELLLETVESPQQKKLLLIYKQALKINHLVDDLLTLALLDSQSIELKFEDYPLELLIEDISIDLQYLLIENNMTIRFNDHVTINCDKKWMGEALKNIIKNYIEKNSNSTIDISVDKSDSLFLIYIQDHGQGFDKEDLPHLFERFYRGKNNDSKGIGIGLSLSKEIINQHHGIIQAMNNNGALIIISIPKINVKKKL